jgi:hypothetical protein
LVFVIVVLLFAGPLLGPGFGVQATVAIASTVGILAELVNRILSLVDRAA